MAILEERGLFWWADETVSETQFPPESSIPGLLIIGDDGQTRLELDGYFPSKHGPMAPMVRRGQLIHKDIQGLLRTSNKRILLTGLTGNGGQFSTNRMSYERYISGHCLLANGFAKVPPSLTFKEIIVPLAGFEQWLRLSAIKITSSKRTVSVKYKRPKDAVYKTADGKLSIHFESAVDSAGAIFGTELSFKETASATLSFSKPLALNELIAHYRLLEDLLLMLTGADHALDWPWVAADKSTQYRLYFLKSGSKAASPPKAHECITNFIQLRDRFGDIWSDWKKKREAFGSGFYLYLGTRRGVTLYIENRFINLVFGLEAFHRRKYPVPGATKLDAKIARIVEQIRGREDKKWLANQLERAKDQPPLGQRLFTTLREVPLGLEETRLKTFCELCAKLRNDISHYGGQPHHETPYNDFILDLESKGQALATLYQALLLFEIGVDADIIKAWMFDGFGSYTIKYHFVKADLLDKSVLDPRL